MVRQRTDASFAALARRRPDLSSRHFGLVFTMTAAPLPAPVRPPAPSRLGFAVPKRHLPRAVDRNALKRVGREAWRLAAWPTERGEVLAMLKLQRTDPAWKALSARALKKCWRAELDELMARLTGGLAARASAPPERRA
jgi:RNase P protein component